MRKITLLLTLLISVTALFANASYREIYIEQYKEIAISEMHRVGIPASIKLAQAILESNAGKSTLAVAANNHFGIKCGSKWQGKTFYRKDDDRNKRGKLIKSCFRSFKSPVESFLEHSDFLSSQNRNRYAFLFNYSTSDYTNWAYGLKKAGYATDPNYPQRLIKIIEDLQLYKYDNPGGLENILVSNTPVFTEPVRQERPGKRKTREPNVFDDGSAGEISMDVFKTKVMTKETNKVQFTYALDGDNIGKVAIRAGVPVKKLVKFNDGIDSYNHRLNSGQKVYLAKKKTKFKGKKKFHYVKAEDDMVSIAQTYGIQLGALYAMNAMPRGTEPAIGEKIRLNGKMRKGNAVQTRMLRIQEDFVEAESEAESTFLGTADKSESESEKIIEGNISNNTIGEEDIPEAAVLNEEVEHSTMEKETPVENIVTSTPIVRLDEPAQAYEPVFYNVSKGDTLWNISQRFGTDVATLKQMNDLSSNTIHLGQKIRIK